MIVRLRGLNDGLDGAADVIGSAIVVGLAAVEPGDDCFEGDRRDERADELAGGLTELPVLW